MVTDDCTFSHVSTSERQDDPALNINLRSKIDRMGLGNGGGEGGEDAWDFLEWLFSEDDAQHCVETPMHRQFTARDYPILSGRSFEGRRDVLEDMSSRMLIVKRHRSGRDYCEFMNAELSYWEWVIQSWNKDGHVEIHEKSNDTGNPQGDSFDGGSVVGGAVGAAEPPWITASLVEGHDASWGYT
ncbi:hypothetical protein I3I95_03680 [bacterium]|nr:hypothetical protein [bacterium]